MKKFLLLLISVAAFSASTKCPQFFPGGVSPDITLKYIEICNSEYVTAFNTDYKDPLYSAEHLTTQSISSADKLTRKDAFHTDTNVPVNSQSSQSAYVGTGYDKGHVVPAGDASTMDNQFQTFSMANMTPQNADNNRNLWRLLETYSRDLTKTHKDVYMISGPIFTGNDSKLKDGTVVPNAYFKILYIPDVNSVVCFYCKNQPKQQRQQVKVSDIEKMTGYKFSEIPMNLKDSVVIVK
jgi:endonuclease G, mitochondrial